MLTQEDEKKEKNYVRALELFLKVDQLETEHKGDEIEWWVVNHLSVAKLAPICLLLI